MVLEGLGEPRWGWAILEKQSTWQSSLPRKAVGGGLFLSAGWAESELGSRQDRRGMMGGGDGEVGVEDGTHVAVTRARVGAGRPRQSQMVQAKVPALHFST